VDHEAVRTGVVEGRAEELDLLMSTDQGPLQGNGPVRGRNRTPRRRRMPRCVRRLSGG
jgi:hypothetical protein